jgi:hypothetical protein
MNLRHCPVCGRIPADGEDIKCNNPECPVNG